MLHDGTINRCAADLRAEEPSRFVAPLRTGFCGIAEACVACCANVPPAATPRCRRIFVAELPETDLPTLTGQAVDSQSNRGVQLMLLALPPHGH